MNRLIIYLGSLFLIMLTSCDDFKETTFKKSEEARFTTPINYDFNNLKLRLNTSIDDTISNIKWRWDYMNSDYPMPDTTGVDSYMNLSQPLFSFNGQTSLPFLSITTNKKMITSFWASILFKLENKQTKSIERLLDSLSIIDLLVDDKVRQSIVTTNRFKQSNENFEETIELLISEEKYEYDRIIYEIKIIKSIK